MRTRAFDGDEGRCRARVGAAGYCGVAGFGFGDDKWWVVVCGQVDEIEVGVVETLIWDLDGDTYFGCFQVELEDG